MFFLCMMIMFISWAFCNSYFKQEWTNKTKQFKNAVGKSDYWLTDGIYINLHIGIILLKMMNQVMIKENKCARDYYFLAAGVIHVLSALGLILVLLLMKIYLP